MSAQIVAILREHAASAAPAELMRRPGVSRQKLYSWRKRGGNLQVRDAERLKALEAENARWMRPVADRALFFRS